MYVRVRCSDLFMFVVYVVEGNSSVVWSVFPRRRLSLSTLVSVTSCKPFGLSDSCYMFKAIWITRLFLHEAIWITRLINMKPFRLPDAFYIKPFGLPFT